MPTPAPKGDAMPMPMGGPYMGACWWYCCSTMTCGCPTVGSPPAGGALRGGGGGSRLILGLLAILASQGPPDIEYG
jgi:hypothetical protein